MCKKHAIEKMEINIWDFKNNLKLVEGMLEKIKSEKEGSFSTQQIIVEKRPHKKFHLSG